MVGTVAQTIQGESNGTPAGMFAVAATIFNRANQGYNGGDPNAIVNAPNQYIAGRGVTPSPTAQQFADAISNGTLPQYGIVGNAVNFQTAGSDTTLGRNPNTVNIGGNNFSDNIVGDGTPTANFVPPAYGGVAPTAGTNNVDNTTNAVAQTDPINSFTGDTTGQASADTGTQTADASNTGGGLIGDAMSILSGIASGGSGAGVTYNANQAAANNEANATGKSLGILGAPDVAKAITSAGNAVTSGFNAVGETLGTKVSQTIADAEAYAGRGLVMVFAVVVFAIGAFFLMPKGTRETIVTTAAKAAG